jgi:hypothetical protein
MTNCVENTHVSMHILLKQQALIKAYVYITFHNLPAVCKITFKIGLSNKKSFLRIQA